MRSDRGFVLIAVIWTAALLALIMVGFTRNAQTFVRSVSNGLESARAEALAESGINIGLLDLLETRRGSGRIGRFPMDGSPVSCAMNDDDVVFVTVQDTGGRVNLNLANEGLLRSLFLGLGLESAAAARYTDTIIDYRDRDDNRRPFGAEAAEYRAAGREIGPKNAPFDSLEELQQVLGFDPAMLARLRPHVTIHSASAGLDPRYVRPELVELLARSTSQVALKSEFSFGTQALPAEFIVSSDQRSVLVSSEARLASGAVYVREAVIELPTNRTSQFRMKVWQHGLKSSFGGAVSEKYVAQPC